MDDSRKLPSPQTSTGLTENAASGLSYLLGFITGIIFYLIEPQNRRVRFNAAQSVIFSIGYIVVEILLGIVFAIFTHLPGIGALFVLLSVIIYPLLGLAVFITWLVLLVKAFTGSDLRLPIIAEYADRFSQPGQSPL